MSHPYRPLPLTDRRSPQLRPALPASRGQLLAAARLGGAAATADLTGRPAEATSAYASWRRLRRQVRGPARQLLRVAFDTGYGRTMQDSDRTMPGSDRTMQGSDRTPL